jgi:hypothetical protein
MAALAALFAGLCAGALHALGGPDHLAGVAPLAAGAGARATWIGVAWGLGHASGALAAALSALALRSLVPDAARQISAHAELLVGVVLIVVGFLGLRRALAGLAHEHRPRPAFALGLLHGAAGLSHLAAVLPAAALAGWRLPLVYLAGYALASLAAIACVARGLGELGERSRLALGACSAASLVVGGVWIARAI